MSDPNAPYPPPGYYPVPTGYPMGYPAPAPQPAPHRHSEEDRQEAMAALSTYRDMGGSWQESVVESFLDRANALAMQQQNSSAMQEARRIEQERYERRMRTTALVTALVLAIPLTAIAAGVSGLLGLVVAWVGIALTAWATTSKLGAARRNQSS